MCWPASSSAAAHWTYPAQRKRWHGWCVTSGVPGGFTSYDDGQTREQLTGWVEKDHIPRVKIKIGES